MLGRAPRWDSAPGHVTRERGKVAAVASPGSQEVHFREDSSPPCKELRERKRYCPRLVKGRKELLRTSNRQQLPSRHKLFCSHPQKDRANECYRERS